MNAAPMTPVKRIASATSALTLSQVPPGFLPLLLTDLVHATKGRVVLIASDAVVMQGVADAAHAFAPDVEVVTLPAWDCLPYDRAGPALHISADRLAGLQALQGQAGPQLVLTSVNAVLQRTLTPFRVRQLVTTIKPGERIDRDRLVGLLTANGFTRTDNVAEKGEYAVRGGLVDLWPASADEPLRVDLFGDEIETVRSFDPADQRTSGDVSAITLLPASEALLDDDTVKRFRERYRERFGANATSDPLYLAVSERRRQAGMEHFLPLFEERLATLFDHLGDDALILRDSGTGKAADQRLESIADYYANRRDADTKAAGSYRPLPPEQLYLTSDEWARMQSDHPIHRVSAFREPEGSSVVDLDVQPSRDFTPERTEGASVYDAIVAHLKERSKGRTVLATYSEGARTRLLKLLSEHGLDGVASVGSWKAAATSPLSALVLPLERGFRTDKLSVLTEQDMLGDRLVRRGRKRKKTDAFLHELASLSQGDLIVHADHGIGRFETLTSLPVSGSPHDCVALSYRGGDKLYVPVENLEVLSRYGAETEGATLDRLGGEAWQRRKSTMKERIRAIAGELMKTAAERALRGGEVLELDDSGLNRFADRFPFDETEDQEQAIADVLADLRSGKPMDRLVCGDVGFGKTEVALRAAFAMAADGHQVAMVCPTTLLARQHFMNFADRFKGFDLNIARLSRLVPAAEAKATKEGLADGSVDIVIGTHALLSKSIDFDRLGLVIVDEEQRFGVTHKERLKALKADVHMLTLTATPIPRTLQMAMSGIRDLSVIQTPPVDRLAVRTYVSSFDPMIIREALLREHYRGGQSFFVVPRVADLPDVEEFLRREVKEVTHITAHGQMTPTEVEDRMSAFVDRKYDVLLATSIVESGIDIPTANTLVVWRADRFGLAQLYQLRGRVGRAKTRAFAYMTTPPGEAITDTAEKRLKILTELDSLGAGFQLASHDLDIRGAGNLLGDEQSGHIKEVGFELYQSMLEDAIAEAKAGGIVAERARDAFSPQITLDAAILIPDDYVPGLDLRMQLYRRLNEFDSPDGIHAFAAELEDRFGKVPEPAENLLKIVEIKLNCRRAGVSKLEVGPRGTLVTFFEDRPPNVEALMAYVERLKGTAKVRPDMKLVIERVWADPPARLNGALKLSAGLAKLAK